MSLSPGVGTRFRQELIFSAEQLRKYWGAAAAVPRCPPLSLLTRSFRGTPKFEFAPSLSCSDFSSEATAVSDGNRFSGARTPACFLPRPVPPRRRVPDFSTCATRAPLAWRLWRSRLLREGSRFGLSDVGFHRTASGAGTPPREATGRPVTGHRGVGTRPNAGPGERGGSRCLPRPAGSSDSAPSSTATVISTAPPAAAAAASPSLSPSPSASASTSEASSASETSTTQTASTLSSPLGTSQVMVTASGLQTARRRRPPGGRPAAGQRQPRRHGRGRRPQPGPHGALAVRSWVSSARLGGVPQPLGALPALALGETPGPPTLLKAVGAGEPAAGGGGGGGRPRRGFLARTRTGPARRRPLRRPTRPSDEIPVYCQAWKGRLKYGPFSGTFVFCSGKGERRSLKEESPEPRVLGLGVSCPYLAACREQPESTRQALFPQGG